jgi:hypothetical protein
MRKFASSGWRRYALAFVVVGVSLGVMGAQCQPPKEPPAEPPPEPSTLSVSATELDFGDVTADGPVGVGAGVSLVLTNKGSDPTTFAFSKEGDTDQMKLSFAANPFACGASGLLNPGQSCSFEVHFNPLSFGPFSGNVIVSGDPGGTVKLPWRGNGAPGFTIELCCGISFNDETADGTSTQSRVFTVTYSGTEATSLVIGLQGGDPSQFDLYRPSPPGDCVYRSQLNPGESCQQTVLFNPTKTGFFTTTVVVTGNPGRTATYGLNGTGV